MQILVKGYTIGQIVGEKYSYNRGGRREKWELWLSTCQIGYNSHRKKVADKFMYITRELQLPDITKCFVAVATILFYCYSPNTSILLTLIKYLLCVWWSPL